VLAILLLAAAAVLGWMAGGAEPRSPEQVAIAAAAVVSALTALYFAVKRR
jgi:hypothetical protein